MSILSSIPDLQLSPSPSGFFKKILLILVVTLIVLSVLGALLWYKENNKKTSQPLISPRPAFSSEKQFVPEGSTALEVDKALTAFGFSKPLPFFEERNVVQSLNLSSATSSAVSTSSPQQISSTFLSYRVVGQSITAVRSALIEYFENLGWTMPNIHDVHTSGSNKIEIVDFLSPAHQNQSISVTLLEMPPISDDNKPIILLVFTARRLNP